MRVYPGLTRIDIRPLQSIHAAAVLWPHAETYLNLDLIALRNAYIHLPHEKGVPSCFGVGGKPVCRHVVLYRLKICVQTCSVI